jgi:hypothetical protein
MITQSLRRVRPSSIPHDEFQLDACYFDYVA